MSDQMILILITTGLVPFTLGLKYFFEKNKDLPPVHDDGSSQE